MTASTVAQSSRTSSIVLAGGALLVAALIGLYLATSDLSPQGVGGIDGELGGDFTLQSLHGDVSLADYRGQIVILYFGFLSCPDVCPTSMGVLTKALNRLDEDALAAVQPILISIDPKRDSLQDLEDYTHYFHPKIIGVTGTPESVERVALDYNAFFEVTDVSEDDYAFWHSSRYYVINQQGTLVDAMRHSTTSNELAARVQSLL